MGKKSLIKFINSGELEKGLVEAENTELLTDFEEKIFYSLILRYQGKTTEAVTILEGIYRKSQTTDDINLKCSLILMVCYLNGRRPSREIEDLRSYITFLLEQVDVKTLGNYWLGLWTYIQGKRLEVHGRLFEAIDTYLQAIKYLEKQENKFEVADLYLQLSMAYRRYGDYNKAKEMTEVCLKISSKIDERRRAYCLTYLAEILCFEFGKEYPKALDYLESALKICKTENIKPGIQWATMDISFVHLLLGNLEKSFDAIQAIYDLKREQESKQFIVRMHLILIELLLELEKKEESKKYVQRIYSIIEFDILYEEEVQLAERLLRRHTQELSDNIIEENIIQGLTKKNKDEYTKKIKILLNQLEILLVELKFAQADEAQSVSRGIINQLLDYADSTLYLLILSTTLLKKFQELSTSKDQEEPFRIIIGSNEHPLFHSLPMLTIFLYILPRRGVVLNDLNNVVPYHQKWIYEYTGEMEKEGLIKTEKKIMDEKEVSEFEITEKGLQVFKEYILATIDFLGQWLV